MNTKPIIALLALACAGCATTPSTITRTYSIHTDPVEAHVQLVQVMDGSRGEENKVIAEGDTTSHQIQFTVVQAEDAIIDARATAPGYEQRPQINEAQPGGGIQTEIHIELSEQLATRENRLAIENKKQREEYVKQATWLKPDIREAILAGDFSVGMSPLDVDAEFGHNNVCEISSSKGEGADVDIYSVSMETKTAYVFFRNGSLVRWSMSPKF